MTLSNSQRTILDRIKTRGPQSVNILSNQLDMSKMGVRQHLQGLESIGLIIQSAPEKQNRGRPVRLWALTDTGHSCYPDQHQQLAIEMIDLLRELQGEESLKQLVFERNQLNISRYRAQLSKLETPAAKLEALVQMRTDEGFLAQLRLTPKGWLLIENHCPIAQAAKKCQYFCDAELALFQSILSPTLAVERSDHIVSGARRCAFLVTEVC